MAEISTAPITPAQVRSIHIVLSRQGIDDATYRAMLRARYDAASCKDLTRRQASDLLTHLGRPLPRPPGSGPAPTPRRRAAAKAQGKAPLRGVVGGRVVALPTPLQRVLIEELAGEVPWREPDGYRRWLSHTMGMERVATRAAASKVIEGLKAMKARGRADGDA